MINALHPMDTKEGGEPHIHNSEAWQLTRWLEEGVFGEPCSFPGMQTPWRSATSAAWCSRSTTTPRTNRNRGSSRRIPVGRAPHSPVRRLHLPGHAAHPAGAQAEQRAQRGEHRRREEPGRTLFSLCFRPQVVLLRTLITLCSTLAPLPRERWITLQLYYYDDITVGPAVSCSLAAARLPAGLLRGQRGVLAAPGRFLLPLRPLRHRGGPPSHRACSLPPPPQPFHAMCMKVRVTEATLQSSQTDAPAAAQTQEPPPPASSRAASTAPSTAHTPNSSTANASTANASTANASTANASTANCPTENSLTANYPAANYPAATHTIPSSTLPASTLHSPSTSSPTASPRSGPLGPDSSRPRHLQSRPARLSARPPVPESVDLVVEPERAEATPRSQRGTGGNT